ncbi:L-rhamnose mutarotase, partial [Burkholderia pseudomallei]
MRSCLALDLKDDPDAFARYEAHNERIWPEVAAYLRAHCVLAMEIFRLGTRMTMVMD